MLQLSQNIEEAKKQLNSGNIELSIIILTLCIEWMGAMIDKKPLKAPKQTKKRFDMAINKLLGGNYAALNRDSFFYEHWRNQLIHTGKPSSLFIITTNKELKHLSKNEDKKIFFNPDVFLIDIESAFKKIIAETSKK
ncbi:MAG: hypothetical protein GYA62_11710 [Bacteroidales bacterium]|jgi:hypothetical protein|nr:hypothetical protein [Bacteroidales bacterium]